MVPSSSSPSWKRVFRVSALPSLHLLFDSANKLIWQIAYQDDMIPILSLFCVCYSHALVTIDDDEFFEQQRYFALKEVTEMTAILKVSENKLPYALVLIISLISALYFECIG